MADSSAEGYVRHYNEVCLHGAIGYVTPAAKLAGRETMMFAKRARKLEAARMRDHSAGRLKLGPPSKGRRQANNDSTPKRFAGGPPDPRTG
jgi:hypothetical protein